MKKLIVLALFCFFAFSMSTQAQYYLILDNGQTEVKVGLVSLEAFESFIAQDAPHFQLPLSDIEYIQYPGYNFYGADVRNTLDEEKSIIIYGPGGTKTGTISKTSDIEILSVGPGGTINNDSDIEIL